MLDDQTGEYREVPASETLKPNPTNPPTPAELGNAVIDAVLHLNNLIATAREVGVEVVVDTLYYTPGGSIRHIIDGLISITVPCTARVAHISNSEETTTKEQANAR
jgi:hypothetical protein